MDSIKGESKIVPVALEEKANEANEAKTADEQSFPSSSEYRKLSLEERTKLLPPPSDDHMAELKAYQKRIIISFATVAKGDTKIDIQGDTQTLSFFEEKFVPEEVDSSVPLLELRQDSSDGTYSVIAKDQNSNVVLEESNIVFEGEKTLLQIYEKILNTNG